MSWKHWLEKMSPEELRAHTSKAGKASKGRKRPDLAERNRGQAHREEVSQSRKAYFESMTPEQRKDSCKNFVEGGHKAFKASVEAMTPEQRKDCWKNFTESGTKALFSRYTSKPEKMFGDLLESQGIPFTKPTEAVRVHGKTYWPDFILEDMIIIEFMGCYTHQCEICGHNGGFHRGGTKKYFSAEEIRALDDQRTKNLESLGYTVKFVWEHQLPDLLKNGYHE